jgi:hypothetical protein
MANWRRRCSRKFLVWLLTCSVFGPGSLVGLRPATAQVLTTQLVHFFAQGARFGVVPKEDTRLVNATGTSLCAMIYVFGQTEDLAEGCGCPLSLGKEVSISLAEDLTLTPFSNENLTQGELLILSALPNNGTSPFANGACDPASAFTPQTGVTAWSEYITTAPTESASAFTPVAFDQALASSAVQTLQEHVTNATALGRCECGNDSTTGD